jgi:hypothetical protein
VFIVRKIATTLAGYAVGIVGYYKIAAFNIVALVILEAGDVFSAPGYYGNGGYQ